MREFWEWFIGEPGAAWILILIGLIVSAINWFRRRRPVRVYLQELDAGYLLGIHHSQRERINVEYTPRTGPKTQVTSLKRKRWALYYTGDEGSLEDFEIELRVVVPDSSEEWDEPSFLDLAFDGPIETEMLLEPDTSRIKGWKIASEYLNSYGKFGDYYVGTLVSDQLVDLAIAEGSGKGWKAELLTRAHPRQKRIEHALRTVSLLGAVAILALFLYEWFTSETPSLRSVASEPTEANIQLTGQAFSDLMDAMRDANRFERYLLEAQFTSGQNVLHSLSLYAILMLAAIAAGAAEHLAAVYARLRLGIEPPTKFID